MVFYESMIPYFMLSVLLCMGYMLFVFSRMKRALPLGAALGIGVGLSGPMLFMAPLNSCTFEAEREPIDFWFGVMLFALGAGVVLYFAQWIARFFLGGEDAPRLGADQSTLGVFRSMPLVPIVLLLPTIVILVIFLYYPLIETFRLSTLLVRLGAPRTRFECVSNFTDYLEPDGFNQTSLLIFVAFLGVMALYRILPRYVSQGWHDVLNLAFATGSVYLAYRFFVMILEEDYGEVMFNTFFIASTIVIGGLIMGLAIAYLAYQPVKGAAFYRTMLIWPYAISPAISGIIFFVIFDPVSGIANHIIELFGGEGLDWIKDPWLARGTIIFASIWKTLGYNILFYIAGLQTVPKDLLEAAQIDGANAWQRFRTVVLPALSPITFFLIVTNLTYAFFNIFGTIDFLTRGGPAGATSVSIYEIVQIGIRSRDLGSAAAQSLVLFVLVIGVTWFQFRTSGRRVTYSA